MGSATVLDLHLKRLGQSKWVTDFCVATTDEEGSEQIVQIAQNQKWQVHVGDLNDVLDRFYQAAKKLKADIVLRATSDCPLIDAFYADDLIEKFLDGRYDYGSNCLIPTLPDGQSIEIFTFAALERAWTEAQLRSEREHVTPYLWKNSDVKGGHLFKALALEYSPNFSNIRMTLDHQEDYSALNELVRLCGEGARAADYVRAAQEHTELGLVDSKFKRLEGYNKSLAQDASRSHS